MVNDGRLGQGKAWHKEIIDSIWEGDANELWNYEKIYEIHGRSIESQKQKEQEGYDKADRDTDPVWTDSEDDCLSNCSAGLNFSS